MRVHPPSGKASRYCCLNVATQQGAIFRTWLESHVLPAFAGRILPVDTAVAQRCAALHVPDPGPAMDSLIAATALVHGMTLVTRNVADFQSSGVTILNPCPVPLRRTRDPGLVERAG